MFSIHSQGSLESDRIALYSFDSGEYRLLLNEEGYNPIYSQSGHILFGRTGVLMDVPFYAMVKADISYTPALRVVGRERLFTENFESISNFANYDINPDGENFLVIRRTGGTSQSQNIVVITGWFEELNKRAIEAAKNIGKVEVDYGDNSCLARDCLKHLTGNRVQSKILKE